jgi:hypothetical protein
MTQFQYRRIPGGRRATIAYDVRAEGGTTIIQAGIAYRSPRDKYLRSYGEAKSKGRLTQLKLADGWQLSEKEPEKYVVLTVHNQAQEEVMGEFNKLLDLIVGGFKPAAVTKQEQKDQ